jgi:hypothetical protein
VSVFGALSERMAEPERRRTVRIIKPRAQLVLAGYLLAVTAVFAALAALNSWSAFGTLLKMALSMAAAPFEADILGQARLYLITSLALLAGYMLCMLAVTIAYVHRLIGPTVAVERFLRALKRGDYGSRLVLRSGDELYVDLAKHLNELAAQLERENAEQPS